MYEKVVIIGAPRSGTNMLRDLLEELPGVGTWPCDEINYIWRHGNVRFPSDEFTPEMATPAIKRYIQAQFDSYAHGHNLNVLVEKTCANSLRVGFVNEVVPDAKYIFIVRDGLDAVGSAMLRWKAELDIPYLMKKVRYVPPTDLPYYGLRYFWHRVYRVFSGEKRLAIWGPVLSDMKSILQKHKLDEACALQWAVCVDAAEQAFSRIPEERVLRVKYEDFVRNPVAEFAKVAQFVGKEMSPEFEKTLLASVSASSVGKGRAQLGSADIERLTPLVQSTLSRYGY
ncbi:MAG: sulfotransferase [Gallionella sp.]|nr:sulfotransferase [Gallionella sp.]